MTVGQHMSDRRHHAQHTTHGHPTCVRLAAVRVVTARQHTVGILLAYKRGGSDTTLLVTGDLFCPVQPLRPAPSYRSSPRRSDPCKAQHKQSEVSEDGTECMDTSVHGSA